MERSAEPCVDFYSYSCGGWRKQNPIPPDQSSWSVYGKLTDENQRFLWGISKRPLIRRRSVTGFSRRSEIFLLLHGRSGHRKGRIRASGTRVAGAGRHQGRKRPRALGCPATSGKLRLQQHDVRLRIIAGYADSSQVIAFAEAGGLGLPDRDYYVKTDATDRRTAKISRSRSKNVELLGDSPAQAARAANGDADRDCAGQSVADPRRSTRSVQDVSQDEPREFRH